MSKLTLKERVQEEFFNRENDNIENYCSLEEAINNGEIINEAIDKQDKKYLDLLNLFDCCICQYKEVYFMLDNQADDFNGRIVGWDSLSEALQYAVEQFSDFYFTDHNIDIEKFWSKEYSNLEECYIE